VFCLEGKRLIKALRELHMKISTTLSYVVTITGCSYAHHCTSDVYTLAAVESFMLGWTLSVL